MTRMTLTAIVSLLLLLASGIAMGQEGKEPLSPKYRAGFLYVCKQACGDANCDQTCRSIANPDYDEETQCRILSGAVENWLVSEWPMVMISPFVEYWATVCTEACEIGAKKGETLTNILGGFGWRDETFTDKADITVKWAAKALLDCCNAAWREGTIYAPKVKQKLAALREQTKNPPKVPPCEYPTVNQCAEALGKADHGRDLMHFACHCDAPHDAVRVFTAVAECENFDKEVRATAKKAAERFAKDLKAEADALLAKRRKEDEERAIAMKNAKRRRQASAPRICKFLSYKACDADKAWYGYRLLDDICERLASKRHAAGELRRLKQYARKHGVIDLARSNYISNFIREMDDVIRAERREYRKVIRRSVQVSLCARREKALAGVDLPDSYTYELNE